MADKIRARWPLYAALTVVALVVVGFGFVMAGGPSKEIARLAASSNDCNAVVSMSQGRQVYSGVALQSTMPADSPLEALTGEQWMLLYKGGQVLSYFTVAANWDTLSEHSRCGTDDEVDRVVFIFDPKGTSNMAADLNTVLGIAHAKFLNAEVDLSLLVGGVGHVTCQIQQVHLVDVAASKTHAQYIGQMTMPDAGADLDVPCDQYADNKGHLTAAGATNALGQLANFYNGASTTTAGQPATTRQTTTTRPTTTTTTVAQIPSTDRFIALLRGTAVAPGDVFWWNATYKRTLPYAPNTGWVDGDRCGYTAMYAFLQRNGVLVGRVTFIRIPGASAYAVVNDKYMDEAERWYNGDPAEEPGTGQDNELKDCPPPNAAYEPYTGPSELPTILYVDNGQTIEVRDYKATVNGPAIKFRQVESTDTRITVLAYENNLPVIVVYYEAPFGNGVVMESDLGLVGG